MGFEKEWNLDSLLVHGGQAPDPTTGARAVPIYQTTSYVFRDADHAADLFNLREAGNIYTRLMNPTTDVFEKRVALLEGGAAALAFSSGHAAIVGALCNILQVGDEIVSSSSLYGGTYNLFVYTLPRFGIKVHFVDSRDPENFRKAITPRTKAFFGETIGNPRMDVLDIKAVADIAHEQGIPLIVDNTFAPYLCQPIAHGADIVIHSATKFIGGSGTSMGGIVVDSGKFDWEAGDFSSLSDPDPSYHNIRYTQDVGALAFITRLRVQILRDLGACLSPFHSFLFIQGLETLHRRMKRHSENAWAVAEFLGNQPEVSWVNYPGVTDPEKTNSYLPRGGGAVMTFGIQGGLESGRKFINSLKLFSLLANIGDTKSLVIHPASTTHSQLTSEQRAAAGSPDDMIRLSIGIEDIEDIFADLKQALVSSQS